MKIVNLDEFLKLPHGTVFMKYEPCIFGSLCVKQESLENDFYADEITYCIESEDSSDFFERLRSAELDGLSLAMDFNCTQRDGMFDDKQLFAVYEDNDVLRLIDKLTKSLRHKNNRG